jgi:hypothetical protein
MCMPYSSRESVVCMLSNVRMGKLIPPSDRGSREMIAKLVEAGYLQPTQHDDADAITKAIFQMKRNLRASVQKTVSEEDSRGT